MVYLGLSVTSYHHRKSGEIINPELHSVLDRAICGPSLLTLWGHKTGQLPSDGSCVDKVDYGREWSGTFNL